MKPITTISPEGRALLALRAGPMTTSEINARINASLPSGLIKAGYVQLANGHYSITPAGIAACPFRNPLAAPGIVQPALIATEPDMSTHHDVTRQEVLAVITEAGNAGITKPDLVARFRHRVGEPAITSHLVMLKKDGEVINPRRGLWQVAGAGLAGADDAVVSQPATDITVDTVETIDIAALPDRRAPLRLDVDADDLEIGIFSDGSMDLLVDDGLDDAHLKLSAGAVNKMRQFLGLFQESA